MIYLFNFITEFISENKALLLSSLAILISLRSFSISQRSLKLSEKTAKDSKKVKASEKRAELLEIIDKKNAKIGNLQSIYGEKHACLVQNQQLSDKYPGEVERILNNVNCLNDLKSQYGIERKNVESFESEIDIPFTQNTLADIKRLLIHIEEDIVKEERGLKLLKEELSRLGKT